MWMHIWDCVCVSTYRMYRRSSLLLMDFEWLGLHYVIALRLLPRLVYNGLMKKKNSGDLECSRLRANLPA